MCDKTEETECLTIRFILSFFICELRPWLGCLKTCWDVSPREENDKALTQKGNVKSCEYFRPVYQTESSAFPNRAFSFHASIFRITCTEKTTENVLEGSTVYCSRETIPFLCSDFHQYPSASTWGLVMLLPWARGISDRSCFVAILCYFPTELSQVILPCLIKAFPPQICHS